jgi:hypothetical protein
MPKPILFHDIDGVLFSDYGPRETFQLRPGVRDWLDWAHANFDVVWLTSWEEPKIKTLLTMIYADVGVPGPLVKFQCAHWMNYLDKTVWLARAVPKLDGREWFWIDDIIPKDLNGLDPERCVYVEPFGEHALVDLQSFFSAKVFQEKMS